MKLSRRSLFIVALSVAAVLSLAGLLPRLGAERANRNVAFVAEYKDLVALSYQSGQNPREVLKSAADAGVLGITVMEYTGEELMNLHPMSLRFGAAGALGVGGDIPDDMAVVVFRSDSPHARQIYEYLQIKLRDVRRVSANGETALVLPGTVELFRQSAFIPDFQGLDFCRDNGASILFRPGSCVAAGGEAVAASLSWLMERYPVISIVPSGAVMAGYPDVAHIADVLKKENVSFAHAEFVKQIGADGMIRRMAPDILSLHSLTKEEILSRRMSRAQIRERFARAAHERSVRLLMMRPYDLEMGGGLDAFIYDLTATKRDIEALGYSFSWPARLPAWQSSPFGAAACALAFLFCLWFYAARLLGVQGGTATPRELAGLALLSLGGAALLLKVSFLAKLAGGFGTAFVATEAALAAMEYYKKPVKGLIFGLFIVFAGGLAVASFYGTYAAALRLTPFSGVKLTLLLPPLLILLHDFRMRVHPESVSEIMGRPAVWGELALVGVMLLAMLVMALRSDNVSSVPGWETSFRDLMERLLLVRPRTKEFAIGYPALILYYYVMRKGWAARYREAFRVAAAVAFSSAVNTFCHFHTELALSALRVATGWGLGIIVGVVAVVLLDRVGAPLWKKGLREAVR